MAGDPRWVSRCTHMHCNNWSCGSATRTEVALGGKSVMSAGAGPFTAVSNKLEVERTTMTVMAVATHCDLCTKFAPL